MDIPKCPFYFHPVNDGFDCYSCDKLRLKFYVYNFLADDFVRLMESFAYHYVAGTPYECKLDYDCYMGHFNKIGSYKIIYTFSYSVVWKIAIGFDLYTAERSDNKHCFIEFNPNKVDTYILLLLLQHIIRFAHKLCNMDYYFELSEFDLAVDIHVPRSCVSLVKTGKRSYTRIVASSVTEYSGKRHTSGFTKVYDKSVEMGLEYSLTRIEITCDNFDSIPYPTVCILRPGDDETDDNINATDRVILRLLRDLDYDAQQQALKEMGRNKANKLKSYLFPQDKIFKFNQLCVAQVIDNIKSIMDVNFEGDFLI